MLVTTRSATLLEDSSTSLNSDRKKKLDGLVSRQTYPGSVPLVKETLLKVINRTPFVYRAIVVKNSTEKQIKRNFQAAYVEVANGPHSGKKGWIVVSVQDPGSSTSTYAMTAPSNFQQKQAAQAAGGQRLANMPELSVSISKATRTGRFEVAGKQVYTVSVANAGGAPTPRNVTVTVKVGNTVVKTERIRDSLGPRGSHAFAVEISDSAVRRHEKLTVEVDTTNIVKEADETNNVYSTTL
jgi:hypothetical protein